MDPMVRMQLLRAARLKRSSQTSQALAAQTPPSRPGGVAQAIQPSDLGAAPVVPPDDDPDRVPTSPQHALYLESLRGFQEDEKTTHQLGNQEEKAKVKALLIAKWEGWHDTLAKEAEKDGKGRKPWQNDIAVYVAIWKLDLAAHGQDWALFAEGVARMKELIRLGQKNPAGFRRPIRQQLADGVVEFLERAGGELSRAHDWRGTRKGDLFTGAANERINLQPVYDALEEINEAQEKPRAIIWQWLFKLTVYELKDLRAALKVGERAELEGAQIKTLLADARSIAGM